MRFNYLSNYDNNTFNINRKVSFRRFETLTYEFVYDVFEFAYQMTFGKEGEHRNHRTGGTHCRRKAEIFANTFQGKLAEYALFYVLNNLKIEVDKPDLGVYALGRWDSEDLLVSGKSVSVKSTKSFGNLLLLEQKDWDNQANYIPNGHGYDYTFLIRMDPFCEDILKRNRMLYSDFIDKKTLEQIILSETWSFDIPGYVTREDLVYIINNDYVIPRCAFLNGKTLMDASNYYVQSGDMRSLREFIDEVKR